MRQRTVFLFWLPLFLSWLLMTAEGPIVSATINRLPNEVIMLAAMGIVVSLSVMIESPIINMLATSTALVKDRATFLLVRRFTVHWMILLTAVTILIAFTPLFDVVMGWMGAPPEVVVWVRPGMQIMTFWSAAIAWRRFLQGVLIGFGRPGKMAWGTAVRLAASGGVAVALGVFSPWPGVVIGAVALMAGVVAEAIFATLAVRPLLQNQLAPTAPVVADAAISYRQLFWFHLPLAATSLMILMVQPLVTSSLAKLDNPVASLAAWPVLFQVLLMARAAAFALPEVVIALSDGPESFTMIRRFTRNLALTITLFMLLFVLTPLSTFYLFVVQDMTAQVGALAQSTLVFYLFFPGLTALGMWLRGMLIHGRHTTDVNMAMIINLVVTAVTLALGVRWRWPGLPSAAAALNLALISEILYLAWRAQRLIPMGLFSFSRARPKPTLPG
ncbi:MAG: hypothetical protein KJ069_11270 [Anaerolineae bacterium]|nr:hypothetical protein [Anaerolineae bacterium]